MAAPYMTRPNGTRKDRTSTVGYHPPVAKPCQDTALLACAVAPYPLDLAPSRVSYFRRDGLSQHLKTNPLPDTFSSEATLKRLSLPRHES